MTIKSKYLGIQIKIGRGADDRRYVYAVVWYPRSCTELGYWHPSLRIWG